MKRLTEIVFGALIVVTLGCAGKAGAAEPEKNNAGKEEPTPTKQVTAAEIARVGPEVVRESVSAGKAMLVCAYDSDVAFEAVKLEGAIARSQFKKKLPTLSKDQEIYFYCA